MTGSVPATEARVYRPGATIIPLFLWAVLTGVSSGFLLHFIAHPPAGFEAKGLAWLMAVSGILFGPVAFFAHLIRMCVVWVRVDPAQGLQFSGGRAVAWSEIRSVELKESAFKDVIRASPMMVFFTAGCWAVIFFVVLPSFALFTPWHGRVIVTLLSGERMVLRDLAQAGSFVEHVSRGIPARPAATGPERP
jgi:hypothetical protein